MKKFRTSYSLLNAWSKGDYQNAIEMYLKKPREINKWMKEGLRYHQEWEEYILKNKKLPKELDKKETKLISPKCELKLEMSINDKMEFVGVIDCLDGQTAYEFKTGSSSSADYANRLQLDCYSVLLEKNNYIIEKGIYIHYDQYIQKTDKSIVYLTDVRRKRAMDWIKKHTSNMYKYFIDNDIPTEPTRLHVIETIE